ncbi:MAG: hypothetical protein R2774_07460 [Saprospiraceae bacterium]
MHYKIILFVVYLLSHSILIAQQNDNSPYSRFGIGDLHDQSFNHLRQMGNLGASYADNFHINIVNPASYAFLNSTAYDLGVFGKFTTLKDAKNKSSFWSGNLDYLGLAFPLYNPINEVYDGKTRKVRLGMAFSLTPYSNVNYNVASEDSLANIGNIILGHYGKGGTYKFQWGNAIKYNDFSFGVNLGYVFGNILYSRTLQFSDYEFAYNDVFSSDYSLKGFTADLGFIYSSILNKKDIAANSATPAKKLNLGLHFTPGTTFNTNATVLDLQTQLLGGYQLDTLQYSTEVKEKGRFPLSVGGGLTYFKGEKFAVGFNFKTTAWSKFYNQATNDDEGDLINSSRYALGGYFRPNYKSYTSFFKRVYYRYGLFYNEDPRKIEGEQLSTFGVNFGIGMPFVYQRKISHVNIGTELGVRGQNTLISENYVKIFLGVTFNDDEWFLKRKYN